MGKLLQIALRNTGRQKKRTVLLGGAIAFGVLVVTLLNGFTGGVVRNISRSLTDVLGGHVYVSGSEVTASRAVIRVLRESDAQGGVGALGRGLQEVSNDVAEVNRRTRTIATLIFGSRQRTQIIDGVDWEREPHFFESLKVVEGALPTSEQANALILPAGVAERLRAQVGEEILARMSTVTGQQNVGAFVLVATVEETGVIGFSPGFARIDHVSQLVGLRSDEYQLLHLYLKDPRTAPVVAAALERSLGVPEPEDVEASVQFGPPSGGGPFGGGGLTKLADAEEAWEGTRFGVTTLDDIMDQVSDLFRVLDTVSLVFFLILLGITMVGVINTFRMILLERYREIGTMRAMGMQRGEVRWIFLLEASFISLMGAAGGLVVAAGAMFGLSFLDLSGPSPLQLFLNEGHLSFAVAPTTIITNLLILVVLSLAAAAFPARKAAKLQPAEALRSAA